jgi:hypothetical protein
MLAWVVCIMLAWVSIDTYKNALNLLSESHQLEQHPSNQQHSHTSQNIPSPSSNMSANTGNVIGGHKANLNNPSMPAPN